MRERDKQQSTCGSTARAIKWAADAAIFNDGVGSHRLVGGNVILHLINDYHWTNPLSRFDVNRDGFISALDALLVINHINRNGAEVNLPGIVFEYYVDVNGSGDSSALDALQVINRLDDQSSSAQMNSAEEAEQEIGLVQFSDFLKTRRDSDMSDDS